MYLVNQTQKGTKMIRSTIRHPSAPIYPERINTVSEYAIDQSQSPEIVGRFALSQTPESARPSQEVIPSQGPQTPVDQQGSGADVGSDQPVNPNGEFIDPTQTPVTGQTNTGDPGFPK